ncbi:hypothetical protein [Burkholderia sp. 3C]
MRKIHFQNSCVRRLFIEEAHPAWPVELATDSQAVADDTVVASRTSYPSIRGVQLVGYRRRRIIPQMRLGQERRPINTEKLHPDVGTTIASTHYEAARMNRRCGMDHAVRSGIEIASSAEDAAERRERKLEEQI